MAIKPEDNSITFTPGITTAITSATIGMGNFQAAMVVPLEKVAELEQELAKLRAEIDELQHGNRRRVAEANRDRG